MRRDDLSGIRALGFHVDAVLLWTVAIETMRMPASSSPALFNCDTPGCALHTLSHLGRDLPFVFVDDLMPH